MPIDFSRLRTPNSADSVLEPREIFRALPNKDRRYQFPRDVQTEVWSRWFAIRQQQNVIVKMNTGSGKTVVGLVILKSCLNEGVGPAFYVAPNPYLANQVTREAGLLGLPVDSDPESLAVRRGRAIGITTIKTLFNGLSRFGVDDSRIEIGSLVVDDAHACMQETEDQFTLTLSSTTDEYAALLNLFRSSLTQQASGRLHELEQGEPNTRLLVPFWTWRQKQPDIARILREARNRDDVKFEWPLLRSVLAECRCVFSGTSVEISPRMLPVDVVPSFSRARRRVFMSATLADDSVMVSHFGVNPQALDHVVVPNSAVGSPGTELEFAL